MFTDFLRDNKLLGRGVDTFAWKIRVGSNSPSVSFVITFNPSWNEVFTSQKESVTTRIKHIQMVIDLCPTIREVWSIINEEDDAFEADSLEEQGLIYKWNTYFMTLKPLG